VKKRIHINQHRLRQGLPAVTVQTYKGPTYHREVTILGPSTVVHSEKPLACGARCWIETEAELYIVED
jgi:hypothetical protein